MFVLKSVILLVVVYTVHCLPMLGNLGMLSSPTDIGENLSQVQNLGQVQNLAKVDNNVLQTGRRKKCSVGQITGIVQNSASPVLNKVQKIKAFAGGQKSATNLGQHMIGDTVEGIHKAAMDSLVEVKDAYNEIKVRPRLFLCLNKSRKLIMQIINNDRN